MSGAVIILCNFAFDYKSHFLAGFTKCKGKFVVHHFLCTAEEGCLCLVEMLVFSPDFSFFSV
jgi:hypothetical protein